MENLSLFSHFPPPICYKYSKFVCSLVWTMLIKFLYNKTYPCGDYTENYLKMTGCNRLVEESVRTRKHSPFSPPETISLLSKNPWMKLKSWTLIHPAEKMHSLVQTPIQDMVAYPKCLFNSLKNILIIISVLDVMDYLVPLSPICDQQSWSPAGFFLFHCSLVRYVF